MITRETWTSVKLYIYIFIFFVWTSWSVHSVQLGQLFPGKSEIRFVQSAFEVWDMKETQRHFQSLKNTIFRSVGFAD